jgi:hypothetical protein
VEFALIMPMMVTALLGVVDVCRAVLAWQLITSAAEEAAEIATAEASTPTALGNYQLTDAQVQAATSAIYAFMPAVNTGNGGNDNSPFSVTLSAIAYTTVATAACPANSACTAWSVVGSFGNNLAPTLDERACTALGQVAAGSAPSLSTVPTAGVTGLSSLIVADVQYTFTPLFLAFITGPIAMFRSAYLPTRVGSATPYVQYIAPAGGSATDVFQNCPGYP